MKTHKIALISQTSRKFQSVNLFLLLHVINVANDFFAMLRQHNIPESKARLVQEVILIKYVSDCNYAILLASSNTLRRSEFSYIRVG